MSTPEPRPEITRVLHALTDRLHESLCNCKAYPAECVSKAQYRRDELVYTLTYAEDALDVAIEQGWTPPAIESPAGVDLIAAERERQQAVEGWTAQHDAEHAGESLAVAACCYALPPTMRRFETATAVPPVSVPTLWPWDAASWKPCDRVRELTKAGALIAAEIDRLNSAPAPVVPATEEPAPTQQWAVRHPDVSLSVHRSPHSVLYTASKLPGGTIVTRASDQAEWQVETNCLCGDSKPADRHFQACPGEDPAPHEPRVWATAADVPQGEPNLTICDAAGDVAARQSAGKWAWTVLGDLVITSQPTPCSWPMRDMQFPVTEVLSGVPTPGGTR